MKEFKIKIRKFRNPESVQKEIERIESIYDKLVKLKNSFYYIKEFETFDNSYPIKKHLPENIKFYYRDFTQTLSGYCGSAKFKALKKDFNDYESFESNVLQALDKSKK